jgi:UDP-3-O-[3-hydroxymyristoyl] glucosamine N-acyltransferase
MNRKDEKKSPDNRRNEKTNELSNALKRIQGISESLDKKSQNPDGSKKLKKIFPASAQIEAEIIRKREQEIEKLKKTERNKFVLTDESITIELKDEKRTLYRIRALKDLETPGIKEGDLGGFVETDKNLSHEGDAWVGGDAMVLDGATVSGNAHVFGKALMHGDDAKAFDEAKIFGNAKIYNSAWIYGNAQIHGNAEIFGNRIINYGRIASNDNKIRRTIRNIFS